MAALIVAAVPAAECSGEAGRSTSFEVKINDALVYSKLASGAFPEFDDVVKAVEAVASGAASTEIKAAESSCTLL